MAKLYLVKDEKSKFYAQIEVTKRTLKFLEELACMLYDEKDMINYHYNGNIKTEDHFSFEKDGIHLIIIMTEKRAHIMVLGLPDNKEIREFFFKNYFFHENPNNKLYK